jgi:hypothetical protein
MFIALPHVLCQHSFTLMMLQGGWVEREEIILLEHRKGDS